MLPQSIVLIYKGRAAQAPQCNAMRTGVAFAETWRGPYEKKTSTQPMPVPGGCEDAAVYVSPSGYYRVIFHCGCNYLMATSRDGIRYTQIGQPVRAAPLPRVRLSVHAGAGRPVLVAWAVTMLQR